MYYGKKVLMVLFQIYLRNIEKINGLAKSEKDIRKCVSHSNCLHTTVHFNSQTKIHF